MKQRKTMAKLSLRKSTILNLRAKLRGGTGITGVCEQNSYGCDTLLCSVVKTACCGIVSELASNCTIC
jgi:hypothetical protein